MEYLVFHDFLKTNARETETKRKRGSSTPLLCFKLVRCHRSHQEIDFLGLQQNEDNHRSEETEERDFLGLQQRITTEVKKPKRDSLGLQQNENNHRSQQTQEIFFLGLQQNAENSRSQQTQEIDFLGLQQNENSHRSEETQEIDFLGLQQNENSHRSEETQEIDFLGLQQNENSHRSEETQEIDFLGLQQNENSRRSEETQEIDFLGLQQDENHYPSQQTQEIDFLGLQQNENNNRSEQTQERDFPGLQQNENNQPQLEQLDEYEHRPPPPVWHIVKTLTRSDVGHLCRLLFTQDHIATLRSHWNPEQVQIISEGEKVRVLIKDADTEFSEHSVVIRRWSSNGLYVMQSGWRPEFVVRRGLKEGDEIGISWNAEESCFLFSVLRRA